MKSWPELLAVLLGSSLIVTGILLRPTCPHAWCSTVECPEVCTADGCHDMQTDECHKYAGDHYTALVVCHRTDGAR